MKEERLQFRPYARLLTMLGDQLIKNERTALVELIKNSYDADADWVKVSFENFNDDMSCDGNSHILVEDNGMGMSPLDVRDAWMRPATPQKYLGKRMGGSKTPKKKRTVQGEKGIGRFAILKLGKKITITTRTHGSNFDSVLVLDFTGFHDEFLPEDNSKEEIFLDQIGVDYSEIPHSEKIKSSHGTIIEIRNLKGAWNDSMLNNLCRDVASLTDPVSRITKSRMTDKFNILVSCNGVNRPVEYENAEDLKGLIENKAVLRIQGEYNSDKNAYVFKENVQGFDEILELNDSKIKGLWIWNNRFKSRQATHTNDKQYKYTCGSFKFSFYIFDFSRGIGGKHELSQKEKGILKQHRIYLYRDGVRVYPYGDQDDDWLSIDTARGTGKAGDFFSNDQTVGWIDITQHENPYLIDKTSREGLIERGNAVKDLVFLIGTLLSYVRQYPYARFQQKRQAKDKTALVREGVIAEYIKEVKTHLEEKGLKQEVKKIVKLEKEYQKERQHLVQRFEIAEELAGVGLSVEMTSHDIMLMMSIASSLGKETATLARRLGSDEIQERAERLVGVLDQIKDGMQDIQSLFKSSRRRRKHLKIEPILDKIYNLYKKPLDKKGITYEKTVISGSPLVANVVDGVVMQVLINLFDNAAYWLDTTESNGEIHVTLNGPEGVLIFSDNGPGIDEEDKPYIFEAFYSGKGQQGRGLGLYIARQLLERYDYSISIAKESKSCLPGANFVIDFVQEDG